MTEYFIDYEKVLADLESKRDALNDAINGIKKLLHVNAQMLPDGTVRQGVGQLTDGGGIASDAFFNMNMPDAIEKYLRMAKKPQTYRTIADALEEGGFTHTSKRFSNTMNTTLNRIANGEDAKVVKLPDGKWGLAEWYAGIKRSRAAKGKEEDSARQGETDETSDDLASEIQAGMDAITNSQPSLPTESEPPSQQSHSAS